VLIGIDTIIVDDIGIDTITITIAIITNATATDDDRAMLSYYKH